MNSKLGHLAKFNLVLAALSFIYIFIVNLIDNHTVRDIIYSLVFTAIYIISAIIVAEKSNKKVFYYAAIAIVSIWMAEFLHFEVIEFIALIIAILFLILIIIIMVVRIASSKKVGLLEFVEAVNAYFLMGIIGSVLFRIVHTFIPGNSFNMPGESLTKTSDFIYFSFVTLTTLGYGDISPIDPFAKSLAIFLSISGQLYLTMIIAVLVGKYLSVKQ